MGKSQESTGTPQGQMDQVRELLFGTQWKELETKFARHEEQYQRELAGMQEAFKHRIESLEHFMRSEINSLLHRIKDEEEERGKSLKSELQAREEALRVERREREEMLKAAEKDRIEAIEILNREIAAALEVTERKVTRLSNTLDTTERELRQLLQSELNGLSGKVEQKYVEALDVLNATSTQIRSDMVYRSSLSSLLTEVALKISGQWSGIIEGQQDSLKSSTATATEQEDE